MPSSDDQPTIRIALAAMLILTGCVTGDRAVPVHPTAYATAYDHRPVALMATGNPARVRSGDASEFRCLALNLYWEARGEGARGMTAVGWVVLNRVSSRQFPATICGVVYQGGEAPPCQFSWWCDGRSDVPRETASWREAQLIAAELLNSPSTDPTRGSLFYHATSIPTPWLRKRQRTAQIGRHVFYR